MNPNQRRRLEKLEAEAAARRLREQPAVDIFAQIESALRADEEFRAGGPYPDDDSCPPGHDPAEWAKTRRMMRIWDRRRLEKFGHLERAAAVPIDPAPTADELLSADGYLDAFEQSSLRMLYEAENTDRAFGEWLAALSHLEPAMDDEDDAEADLAAPAADADADGGDNQAAGHED